MRRRSIPILSPSNSDHDQLLQKFDKMITEEENKPEDLPLTPAMLGQSKEIPVVSPSDTDRRLASQKLDRRIKGMKEMCAYDEKEKARPIVVRCHKAELEWYECRKLMLEGLDSRIGKIYASSGQRNMDNDRMKNVFEGSWESDWCLIEIENAKPLEDTTFPVDSKKYKATTYQHISPFKHYDVMKFGKTSGKTIGTVSAALTSLRKRGDPLPRLPSPNKYPSVTSYRQPGARVLRKGEARPVGHEDSISLCHAIRSRREKTFFMEKGDSGCFILLDPTTNATPSPDSAPIVGVGFGSNENTGNAYMMPFDLVVQDIKDTTGRTVDQPRDAGDALPRTEPSE
jgi:hypothetical protein